MRIITILINHVTNLVTYAWNKIYFLLLTLPFWENQRAYLSHKTSELTSEYNRSAF